jgi:hypothetical protein
MAIGSGFLTFLNPDECNEYFRLGAAWFSYYPADEQPYQIRYNTFKLEKRNMIKLKKSIRLKVRPITLRSLENNGMGSQTLQALGFVYKIPESPLLMLCCFL